MEHAEGFRWRERREHERNAWLASVLLHAWVRNAPTPQQLLNESVADPEAALEQVVNGKPDPLTALDAALAVQAERRAHGGR